MEQMYPLYTNKDKEHEHFFSRRKKREKGETDLGRGPEAEGGSKGDPSFRLSRNYIFFWQKGQSITVLEF